MDRSTMLFAKPSFLRGMAKVLDIGATSNIYNTSSSDIEADIKALRADWNAVGDDMRESLDEYKKQVKNGKI